MRTGCCVDCGKPCCEEATRCRKCFLAFVQRKSTYCIDCGAVIDKRSSRCKGCALREHWKNNEQRRRQLSVRTKTAWEHGTFDSVEYRRRLSDGVSASWQNEVIRQSHLDGIQAACQTDEFRQLMSGLQKAQWQDEDYRRKTIEGMQAVRTEEWIQAHSGENAPNWRGGLSLEPYGPGWIETLREQIRERDGRICQFCDAREDKEKLHIHHIDYSKTNHAPGNLIALCRACHTRTGYNRAKWQARCIAIMGKRRLADETNDSIGR